MSLEEREEWRRDFWSTIDSQAGYDPFGSSGDGWRSQREGQCIALRSDRDRCRNLVPPGAGMCDLHFGHFIRWATDHLETLAVRRARMYAPDAFRFVIDQARLQDAVSVLDAAQARVYFIACDEFVKIGYSKHPAARLAAIKQQRNGKSRTLCPEGVDLAEAVIVGEIPGGQRVEQKLHSLLANYRYVGEWFRITPTVIAAIDCVVFGADPPRTIEAGLRDMYSDNPGSGRRRNQDYAA